MIRRTGDLIGLYFRRSLKIWSFWRVSFLMDVASLVTSIAMVFFVASLVGDSMDSLLTNYGGDYLSFVILGVCLNSFGATAVSGPRHLISAAFWNNFSEMLYLAPSGIEMYILGGSLFQYSLASFNLILYVAIGWTIFGLRLSQTASYGIAILTLVLLIYSLLGLGLVSASTFYLINAKAGPEPVSWVVGMLVGLVSGVYFPVDVIPAWLKPVSFLLPHTHAFRTVRVALLGHASITTWPVASDLLYLAGFGTLCLPIGYVLLRASFKQSQKDGTISKWW